MSSEELKHFNYITDIIMWETFKNELFTDPNGYVSYYPWEEFINSKNLGIECNREYGTEKFIQFTYKIVDEKKWDYTKIKYEFI